MSTAPAICAEVSWHAHVQSPDDEWSGVTDPKIRRKLQNRLNQRAARRRKAVHELAAGTSSTTRSADAKSGHHNNSGGDSPHRHPTVDEGGRWRSTPMSGACHWHDASDQPPGRSSFDSIGDRHACHRWYEGLLEHRLIDMATGMAQLPTDREAPWASPLPHDHLISLVYYNVHRALIHNVRLLGLDLNLMHMDDYPSPFPPLSPTASARLHRLPPSLRPTRLQETVAHHPEWDVFPDPVIRDNILRHGEDNIDDVELCLDVVGHGGYYDPANPATHHENGIIVWGEPWDPYGWEVTEFFARKWPFLFRGALAVQQSTNRWRTQRGEPLLDFSRILALD